MSDTVSCIKIFRSANSVVALTACVLSRNNNKISISFSGFHSSRVFKTSNDFLHCVYLISVISHTNVLCYSYCLAIVSDHPIDFHFNLAFTYVIPNGTIEELKEKLLVVSEQGCSDYIVNMRHQSKFMTAFDMANKAGSVRRSDKKIIFLPVSDNVYYRKESLHLFFMKQIEYVANIIMILPKTVQGSCDVYDLVTHKFGGSDSEIHQPMFLDQWDSCSQKFKLNANLFPHDLHNLFGKTVKVGTFHYKPYVLLDVSLALAPTGRDGMEIRIVEEFCRWINCTIEIIREDKDQWGEVFANGSGNGVIGSVVEDRADLGICGIYSWYEEFIYLDFSTPHIRSSVTCVAPSPRLLATWAMPMRPFTWNMWCGVVITFFFAAGALIMAKKYNSDGVFLVVFGIMIAQSQKNAEMNWRVRSVTGWLLVAGLILVSAYGGGLASTFTVPKYESSIDTMQDLADQNMEWGATHDAWVFSLLLSTEPLVKQIIKQFRNYPEKELKRKSFENNIAFGIEILPAGHFAIGEYLTQEALADMTLMVEDFYYGEVVVVLRKSSPYTEKLSVLVGRLQQSGIILAWENQVALKHLNLQKQLVIKQSRLKKNAGFVKPLNLNNVMGIFILYGIGVILSILLFMAEQIRRKSPVSIDP